MEVDVLYKIPNDLIFRYIKRYVRSKSIKLALYCACDDNYLAKKTILNTLPLLNHLNGIMAVECTFKNISDILKINSDLKYNFTQSIALFVTKEDIDNKIIPYVVYSPTFICDTFSKEQPFDYFLKYTKTRDNVLLMGHQASVAISRIKSLCRYVIAFTDNEIITMLAKKDGVKEIDVL